MLRQNILIATLALGLAVPNRASAQPMLEVPLVVVLWEHVNFSGTKRTLVDETPNLTRQDFNDRASSVAIHPGPSYRAWKQVNGGREPTVTLTVDSGGRAAAIVLRAGLYPNLHTLGMGDKVSSVYFTGAKAGAIAPRGSAAPFNSILLVVQLYTDARYQGYELTLVESTRDIKADFGARFHDKISSATLRKGPNYSGGRSVELCVDAYFDQCYLRSFDQTFGLHDFGSKFQDDPTPLQDSISSVRIK